MKANIERAAKDRRNRRDADKVEKTQLRAARLQRLAELQGQQSAEGMLALSAVPDGAVETVGGRGKGAAMLAAGVGAQNSFAVKAGRRTLAASGHVEELPEGDALAGVATAEGLADGSRSGEEGGEADEELLVSTVHTHSPAQLD